MFLVILEQFIAIVVTKGTIVQDKICDTFNSLIN